MTHKATSTQSGSRLTHSSDASLIEAIQTHNNCETISFHTPGHKGKTPFKDASGAWQLDVTELPGLDDLSQPTGCLQSLEKTAADIWGAETTLISTNGASAALTAAILACAPNGQKFLLPRHAHRSAISALVLSGLEPVWYESEWDAQWQNFTCVELSSFERILDATSSNLAGALVVSPTYSGSISDIRSINSLCRKKNVPLIVDEAHGAHMLGKHGLPKSAMTDGADLVIHSLHKTLGVLTQVGLVHVAKNGKVAPPAVRSALNLLQSSSPSYLLLSSLEQELKILKNGEQLARLAKLRPAFDAAIEQGAHLSVFKSKGNIDSDPLHILVKISGMQSTELADFCRQRGIFPEAVLGQGVLFLLGVGNTEGQAETLAQTLEQMAKTVRPNDQEQDQSSPPFGEQIMSPRQAYFSACELIESQHAIGRVAAECIAPCPPGVPIVIPGARLTKEAVALCRQTHLRVVVNSNSRRT